MLALGPTTAVAALVVIHPVLATADQLAIRWPRGGRPVVMIESDIAITRPRWEFRTDGLWVQQVCETPHDHWSYGLEAFALQLDDTSELIRTGYGTRVPMGWELDFVAAAAPRWLLTESAPTDVAGAYSQTGTVDGLLLGLQGEQEITGTAQRWHWWGTEPFTGAGIGRPSEPPARLEIPLLSAIYQVAMSPTSLALTRNAALSA